jgi:hypothetical protein
MRTLAVAVGAVLIGWLTLALSLGAPEPIKVVAAGLSALSALLALVLLVAERRATRTDLSISRAALSGTAAPSVTVPPADSIDEAGPDDCVVFLIYAPQDETWRVRIETMLRPLAQRRLVLVSENDLTSHPLANERRERIVARADAALILVSPELLASQTFLTRELPGLRGRETPMAFVRLRPTSIPEASFPLGVQWVHDEGTSLVDAPDSDRAVVGVCIAFLASVVPTLAIPAARTLMPPRRSSYGNGVTLEPDDRTGRLNGVPALPAEFVPRDEFVELRDLLISPGLNAVGITGQALTLHGQGGIGKTVLAAALAHDHETRRYFPDGIYWVTVGERGDVLSLQLTLLRQLDFASSRIRSLDGAAAELRNAFGSQRILLVVDDIWSVGDALAFDVASQQSRVLYTTRDGTLMRSIGADVRRVGVLSNSAAKALLAKLTGVHVEALPPTADRVLDATGHVALAVALLGAAIGRRGRSWEDVAQELIHGEESFLGHPYADVFKAMTVAVAALDDSSQAAYRALAVFPRDIHIPVDAAGRLWTCAHRICIADGPQVV